MLWIVLLIALLHLSSGVNIWEDSDFHEERNLRAPPLDGEMLALRRLKPLKSEKEYIMFWRPQKVGSSTILSILMSYAYRYNLIPRRKSTNNAFCRMIGYCALKSQIYDEDALMVKNLEKLTSAQSESEKRKKGGPKTIQQQINSQIGPFQLSLTHELCNFNATILQQHMLCAFNIVKNMSGSFQMRTPAQVKEVFLVREPLSRAVSIYYFWGELFKLAQERKNVMDERKKKKKSGEGMVFSNVNLDNIKLGKNVPMNKSIEGALFRYHGDESTVPPTETAVKFANVFPYRAGMPGPSFTWSAFASSAATAIDRIKTEDTQNPLVALVLERLDESLVLLRHQFNWSLADVVTIMHRKALSSHPKHHSWPSESIQLLRKKLNNTGEVAVYQASNEMLTRRLHSLQMIHHINVKEEVQMLKDLRKRATEICLSNISYLSNYRAMMENDQLKPHPAKNKLRDVDEKFVEGGHVFSFNIEILGSFDVCGNCEAHALLAGVEFGLSSHILNSTSLFELPNHVRAAKGIALKKCPQPPKKNNAWTPSMLFS